MIISYAWTTDALLAGRKSVTRRNWNPGYAAKFREGTVHDAFDHLPRAHGKKIGDVQIARVPYPERASDIPDADFEGEGLKYMEEKGLLIRGITPRAWFERWRASDETLFVVRFRLVFHCDRCGEWTDADKIGPNSYRLRLCPLCAADWQYYADDHSQELNRSLAAWKGGYEAFCQTKGKGGSL